MWIPSILLTRLSTLLIPGTATLSRFPRFTRLAIQFSNQRFVIDVPLVVIAAVIVIVVAGSGCAPIAVIEVASA